jgi:hypothetical protein
MPNDAKLGLVIGVSLVIAVALMLFRKDAPAAPVGAEPPPSGIVQSPEGPHSTGRPAAGRPAGRRPAQPAPRP